MRLSPDIKQVILDTSQHIEAIYARFGFVVKKVVPNGYRVGLGRWDMAADLKVADMILLKRTADEWSSPHPEYPTGGQNAFTTMHREL